MGAWPDTARSTGVASLDVRPAARLAVPPLDAAGDMPYDSIGMPVCIFLRRDAMRILTRRQVATWAAVLTVLMEAATATLRFGFGLKSPQYTGSTVGVLTGGIRVHHGYIGVLVVVAALFLGTARPALARLMLVVGIACIASDLAHHFLVLWPIVGSPCWDFTYPPAS
jgi:hypothetical protein